MGAASLRRSTIANPVSCHFQGCKALLRISGAISSIMPLPFFIEFDTDRLGTYDTISDQ